MGNEVGAADAEDRLAHVAVEVDEGLDREGGGDAGRLLQLGPEAVVGDRLHAAVGVVDQHDLLGAELALGDGDRPDHVAGDDPTGVPEDVGLADVQAQCLEDVEPRVHAGHDREFARRADVEVLLRERRGEGPIVLE